MDTDKTTENVAVDVKDGAESEVETVAVPRKEYDTLNQTLGSLKKQLKDLKKAQEETKEPSKAEPEQFGLLHKSYLRAAGITDPEEVELARDTAKKWGVEVDALVDDEDFKAKLERLRTAKANADATSNVRGGPSKSQAKNDAAYWIAKGTPPSATDVPDRKTRATIARAMMKNAATNGKTFYND